MNVSTAKAKIKTGLPEIYFLLHKYEGEVPKEVLRKFRRNRKAREMRAAAKVNARKKKR